MAQGAHVEDIAPGSYAAVGMQPPPQPKEPPPRPTQRGAPLGQPQQQHAPPLELPWPTTIQPFSKPPPMPQAFTGTLPRYRN